MAVPTPNQPMLSFSGSVKITQGGVKGEVLRMPQAQYIKDLYENKGLSLREISERTQHHFGTVQKYAYLDNWNQPTVPAYPAG